MYRIERLDTTASRVAGAVTSTSEFNVATFALLLNFAWEIQVAAVEDECAAVYRW